MIPAETRPALVPGTTVFDIDPGPEGASAGGKPWRIFLYVPPGAAPEGGWPVLYYFDANAVAGTMADIMRVQAAWPLGTGIEWGVMVGVGYPTDEAYDGLRRSWDLGPPPGRGYPPFTPGGPEVRTGGADAFLDFIVDELKPEIARRLPVDPARQGILGHSFGGLFVLHALLRRPADFCRWISLSPAIWWEDAGIVAAAEAFIAGGGTAQGRALILAGEYEQALAPFQHGAADEAKRRAGFVESRTVDHAREMAARLAAVPGLRSDFVLLPGETHMSVLPAGLNLAIRCAFGREG